MSQLLTENELAEELNLSRSFLWGLRKRGLPHLRIGRTVRYEFQTVADWLTQNYKQDTASSPKQEGVEK